MEKLNSDLQPVWPKISVITFVKNGAVTLEKAIRSVASQGYPAVEHIVLDAGSIDGTVDIIQRYQQNLSFWRSYPDAGSVPAINEGWRRATGDVICLLCADDWLEPGTLWAVADAFTKDPGLEVVTGGVRKVRYDAHCGMLRVLTFEDENLLRLSVSNALYPTLTNAHFVRRRLYKELGGFDERFLTSADLDFLLRLAFRGVKNRVLNRVVYNFLQHPGSNSMSGDWKKNGVIAWDNMRVVEGHLKRVGLPLNYVRQLRSFHGVFAMRAIYAALRKADFWEFWNASQRAFRINPAWPVLVIGWIINGLRKRMERRRHVTYVWP